jgi:hypothetical protein
MTKMRSFRFPSKKLEQLIEIADCMHDGNQTQAILEAIDRYHTALNPPRLQGYIQLDRVSNGNEGDCPGCKRSDAKRSWIAVFSNGSVKGVLCDDCVDAESI